MAPSVLGVFDGRTNMNNKVQTYAQLSKDTADVLQTV